jgi:hypothetical protein
VAKDFDPFDFTAVPHLSRPQVLEPARGEWIEQRANLCLIGSPGSRAPEAVGLLTDCVSRLFGRGPQVHCERQRRPAGLRPEQVAVGVAHNDQKDFLRLALAARGLGGVVVETANKLQGLEFEVVLIWHPLAGLPEADGFHLDPGGCACC